VARNLLAANHPGVRVVKTLAEKIAEQEKTTGGNMYRMMGVSLLSLSLMGCLFVVDSKQKAGVSQWSNQELNRIEVGQTRADWIRSSFGAPDRVSTYDDGTEVWRYRNSASSESKIGLFLLFRINVERESAETLALEIRDAVVSDYWVETR
jgi:hypothetical protein